MVLHSALAMRMFLLAAGCFAILSTNFSFQRMPETRALDQLAMAPNLSVKNPIHSIQDVAGNSSVVLSGKQYTYFYPKRLANSTRYTAKQPMFMLTGILSAMKNKVERNLIRNTWASFLGDGSYLFVVASEYATADLVEEMAQFQDLLVVSASEVYHGVATILPQKVQTFFHAAATVLPHTPEYIFKTDDDTFVHPYRLKVNLKHRRPQYWGKKQTKSLVIRNTTHKWHVSEKIYPYDFYPDYCAGAGYAMSKKFFQCAVKHLADTPFMPMEDVGTGILAKKCRVRARHSSLVYDWDGFGSFDRLIVQHRVKNHTDMLQFWEKLKKDPYQDVKAVKFTPKKKRENVTFSDGTVKEMVLNETSLEDF
ncbi:MAG: hypothetical protein SGARI_000576, partial [Bacillariaceae sp.]